MPVFLGSDTHCVSDTGLTDVQVTDPALLIGERLARILQTPRGGFAAVNDDPNRGWDCKQYINAKLTPQVIAIAQQQIQNECLKDEEVQSVNVIFNVVNGALQAITINGVSSSGPLTFVGNVNTLTSSIFFTFQ